MTNQMALASSHKLMVPHTEVSGSMKFNKATVPKNGWITVFTRVNLRTTRKTDLDFTNGQMAKNILATGKITLWMARVSAHGLMEKSIRENGLKTLNTGEVCTSGVTEECTMVTTIKIRNTAGVSIDGLTGECILDSGSMETMLKRESIFYQMVM